MLIHITHNGMLGGSDLGSLSVIQVLAVMGVAVVILNRLLDLVYPAVK